MEGNSLTYGNLGKIVEKGVKKLPEWLEYDSNTSVLTGTPGLGDLGVYTMRMRADCIDPAVTFCHDRISRTFHIRVDEPIKSAESREFIFQKNCYININNIIAFSLKICKYINKKHRRPSKRVPDSDKPMFLEDRRPIIFPEELEMLDPSMKPKGPLVLPADYLQETLPEVPPHGRPSPPYRAAPSTEEGPPVPPHHSFGGPLPQDALSDPPPYRLPPPYFNPHRLSYIQ
ncbi:hypothetical protein MAR_012025 [Mya arenaria]|uniref:Uncharacterized protein n=1 Tax=Mya arenaria TaxID=6604 RepID=A0ABY7G4V3_MYAAR|nr:hypothetical protein MAR_012025 [Mya arenaria]